MASEFYKVILLPSRPSSKIYSINKLGDGLYLKLFLEFSETFWEKDQVNNIIRADLVRGNYIHFQSLSQVLPGKPSILLATVTGEKAKSIYNLTKIQVEEDIMTILRTMYGKTIPNPVALTIPDWGINPLYNEMYSFRAYGFANEDLKSIRAPMGGIYFTGAALSDEEEYVQGACLFGISTANEILREIGALEMKEGQNLIQDSWCLLMLLLLVSLVLFSLVVVQKFRNRQI